MAFLLIKERFFAVLDVPESPLIVIEFRSVNVKPTGYSLRFSKDTFVGWVFEASVDGEVWIALHKARRQHLPGQSAHDPHDPFEDVGCDPFSEKWVTSEPDEGCLREVLLEYDENAFRFNFEVDSSVATASYKFFRFRSDSAVPSWVRATGFEIYGEIQED